MNKWEQAGSGQRGQAIIEYVLLLVVVVTLALALANRFFSPFREWANFYIGEYVECLLDEGELPALGGQNKVTECTPPAPFKDGGGGSGGNKGSTASNSNQQQKKENESSDRGRSTGGSIQSRAGTSGSRIVRVGATDTPGESNVKPVAAAETKVNSGELRVRTYGNDPRVGQGRFQRSIGLSGLLQSEREKIKRRESKIIKAVASASEEAGAGNGRRIEMKERTRKLIDPNFETGDWSFGKWLRLLLILAIIIALVLVVAGQLVQISKSMEK